MGQLADWRCHKVVKAGKILEMPDGGSGVVTIEDVNGAPCKVTMPGNAFARGRPVVGDYVVVYEDDYKSWSPAKAFEEGYSKI